MGMQKDVVKRMRMQHFTKSFKNRISREIKKKKVNRGLTGPQPSYMRVGMLEDEVTSWLSTTLPVWPWHPEVVQGAMWEH